MFICGLCKTNSKPGERMFKAPDKTHRVEDPKNPLGYTLQILREIKLCEACAKTYKAMLAEAAPTLNPQSAHAALVN